MMSKFILSSSLNSSQDKIYSQSGLITRWPLVRVQVGPQFFPRRICGGGFLFLYENFPFQNRHTCTNSLIFATILLWKFQKTNSGFQ